MIKAKTQRKYFAGQADESLLFLLPKKILKIFDPV
jgi:hypothetical protein